MKNERTNAKKLKNLKINVKGITLIALVVTIIVLLILAGVSIAMLTGNNGILTQAQNSKVKTEEATEKEGVGLAVIDAKIGDNGYEELNQTNLQDAIDKHFGKSVATVIDNKDGSFTVLFNGTDRMYDINKFGEVKEESALTLAGQIKNGKIIKGSYIDYIPDTLSSTSSEFTNLISDLQTYSGASDNTSDTLAQELSLKWRILDVKDGKVRLISDKPTSSKISLYGQQGYNNAVYLLDEACRTLYNNSIYADNAQNIKIEDIENYLLYDYTQNETIQNGPSIKYGTTKTYTENKYYPNIFQYEKNGKIDNENTKGSLNVSEQDRLLDDVINEAKENISIQHMHWFKQMNEDDFEDKIYYELFIKKDENVYNTYLLSSRCLYAANVSKVAFNIYKISRGNVDSHAFYYSNNISEGTPIAFRPVITLNEDVSIASGKGTEEEPYVLNIK